MKKSTVGLLLLAGVIMLLPSCSREVLLETDGEQAAETTRSTLVVRTRGGEAAAGGAVVSYPVSIYVFDGAGGCVAVTTIADGDTPVSLPLAEGVYDVYAVAGASAGDYILPTEDDASAQSVITLRDGKRHGDIMTAVNTVEMVDGDTNILTLALTRKVMLLQDVTIRNVPSSVTAVSVTIAPLYENICIDGSYTGTAGSQTVALSRQGETGEWKNTEAVYMLAALSPATVTVRMTTDGKTTGYSYTCGDGLDANYKITISGAYTGTVGVELTGTISGAEWAGEHNITFDFDEDGSSETGKDGSGGSGDNGNGGTGATPDDETQTVVGEAVPALYSLYKGAAVFSVEPQADNTTIVKVVTPTASNSNAIDENDPARTKELVDIMIGKVAVPGIDVWRLPTYKEIVPIVTNRTSINKSLTENIESYFSYFYQGTDGKILSYYGGDGDAPPFKSSRVRAVATLIFK